ncbi:nucleoside deaminase [Methylomicrobium lacus]|uniref:nucleoside deaminase n=1 Tax=Methylomicrobium lacus TaxID=136992 RepID=UPI0035A956AB
MNHEHFMRRAIELAREAPRYPFGAVIIQRENGQCVGEGFNRSDLNPTFHGEMVAINDCARRHRPEDWSGFDLYTTAEPCVMCQGAIEWAGIGRVFYGASIPYLQQLGWWQIDLRAADISARAAFRQTLILGGVLETECNALFAAAQKGRFDDGSN